MQDALAKRVRCLVLYATETGRAERYARALTEMFRRSFNVKVMQDLFQL